MDTRWRRFSRSTTTKLIAFVLVILSFIGVLTIFTNIVLVRNADLDIVLQDSYYQSSDYLSNRSDFVNTLIRITQEYKSEENILQGGTLENSDIYYQEEKLFRDYQMNSKSYDYALTTVENYKKFQEEYADKISKMRSDLIEAELKNYRSLLRSLDKNPGIVYYTKNGYGQLTNSADLNKEYFKSFSSYIVLDKSEESFYPPETTEYNSFLNNMVTGEGGTQELLYIAFTDEYLSPRITTWNENKILVQNSLYQIAGLALLLILAFIYLVRVTGRKYEDENGIHLNFFDRLYNDVNLAFCLGLSGLWVGAMTELRLYRSIYLSFSVTLFMAALGLILVLSLVKHLKNGTLIKHSLTYVVFYQLFSFCRDIYSNGSVAVKVVLIVVGYPLLAALTFFIFPITLGGAAWLALKKVKEFNAIKEGVKLVKEGNINHTIGVSGDGELARLALDINSITDGLSKAVQEGIKSERLKSELITNVSHDIRTPLTAIITYIDLLKNEKDPTKAEEYVRVIDQKSQRLKSLTEDLFEAAKASSGSIPVCFETIEILSLLKQGLGELDDKIKERGLEFRLNCGLDKLYVKADGKLLWRAIENLFSNILKYALEGSRVYIDITNSGQWVQVVIKNISAYELNISADELMERFSRGDESRSSQGSGLGLSIARSLVEIQKGSFNIEIDGDLFKAIIQISKAD